MNRKLIFAAAVAAAVGLSAHYAQARERVLHIVTTGDVHGAFFTESGKGVKMRNSLMSVKHYVDSLRNVAGEDNVLLLDAGDILQGDNAAYYYNYVATDVPHIYPLVAKYMGYDVIVFGNHDIETGHPVYDRVAGELNAQGIPVLGGNVVRAEDGSEYFPAWTIVRKGGLKIAVLGFNNANIKSWLPQELWKGLDFKSITDCAQAYVDEMRAQEKPDLVVLASHSGTGRGDGTMLENQSLDLFNSLSGIDVLVGAHDHRSTSLAREDGAVYVNGGSKASAVGHVTVSYRKPCIGRARIVSSSPEVVKMDRNLADIAMGEQFEFARKAVREYSQMLIGRLEMPLYSREAYCGMSDYINLIHSVQLASTGAQISFAAPLSFNGRVRSGDVRVNDLFTIYPYENQLFVIKLKGSEIKDYLEYSYNQWIVSDDSDHILRIKEEHDERTNSGRWSFVGRSYNFDSAAGLVYTVDICRPFGERVEIEGLADGSRFDLDKWYTVAMTSYRANGGGSLLTKGAGIEHSELEGRVVSRHPEIRELIRALFEAEKVISPEMVGKASLLGKWEFVPRERAAELLEKDMKLLF